MKKIAFLVLTFCSTVLMGQVNLSSGLISKYNFDGNANDNSGNNLHGIVTGALLTTDRFGNENSAYLFDGVNDYISVTDHDLLDVDNISISVWAKPTSFPSNYSGVVSKNRPVVDNQGGFITATTNESLRLSARFEGGTSVAPWVSGKVELDQWQHFVYIISNGVLKIYKNGVKVVEDSSNLGKKLAKTEVPLLIGKTIWFPGSELNEYYFHGSIDDISIYNRDLSMSEINILFNGNKEIACYSFNGNANDISGNNLHGTVIGASLTADRFGNANSAYFFDGVNDYISVADHDLFDVDNISIGVWAKPTSFPSNYSGVVSKNRPVANNQGGFITATTNGSLRLSARFEDGTSVAPWVTGKVELDQWQYFVYIISNGVINIYKNGVKVVEESSNLGKKLAKTEVPLLIGKTYWFPGSELNEYYFHGSIDDICIYNGELTEEEIFSYYSSEILTNNIGEDGKEAIKVLAFPNPSNSGIFNLNGIKENIKEIFVYNSLGVLVIHQKGTQIEQKIDLSLFPKGNYLVKINEGEKMLYLLNMKD